MNLLDFNKWNCLILCEAIKLIYLLFIIIIIIIIIVIITTII